MMEKPKKDTFTDSSWDRAIDAYEKFLPDENEIYEIIHTSLLVDYHGIDRKMYEVRALAKKIAKRIGRL